MENHLGRPTKYKPEYCDEIVELSTYKPPYEKIDATGKTIKIKEHLPMNFTQIAHYWGISEWSIWKWRKENSNFSNACMRAREAHKAWFYSQIQHGLWETTEKHGNDMHSIRLNTGAAKLYGWINFRISERALDHADKLDLPKEYHDKNTSIEDKQQMLDEALISGKIKPAVYDVMCKPLQAQFDRTKGLEAKEELAEMKEFVKKMKNK